MLISFFLFSEQGKENQFWSCDPIVSYGKTQDMWSSKTPYKQTKKHKICDSYTQKLKNRKGFSLSLNHNFFFAKIQYDS